MSQQAIEHPGLAATGTTSLHGVRQMTSIDWILASAGPVAIGAILGMQSGAPAIVEKSLALPLLLVGVAVIMLPALYIGISLIGAAPPARDVMRAVARGFRACGVILLGLTAPSAFLLATSQNGVLAALLGAAVVAVGAFAGLRVIFSDLVSRRSEPVLIAAVFALWSLVSLAIGARMYFQVMAG